MRFGTTTGRSGATGIWRRHRLDRSQPGDWPGNLFRRKNHFHIAETNGLAGLQRAFLNWVAIDLSAIGRAEVFHHQRRR